MNMYVQAILKKPTESVNKHTLQIFWVGLKVEALT